MAYEKTNWTSTTPINATNLNKIENNMEDVNNKFNYSTEEQVIGTWTDGKPLYKRVFNLTSPSTQEATVLFALDDYNIDKIIKIDGVLYGEVPINYFYSESEYSCVWFSGRQLKQKTMVYRNRSEFIILEYTKTTD